MSACKTLHGHLILMLPLCRRWVNRTHDPSRIEAGLDALRKLRQTLNIQILHTLIVLVLLAPFTVNASASSATVFCVDPNWSPFEIIDEAGQHVGIAADLLSLVAQRTGVPMRLLKTSDWPESLEASKSGRCQFISLLNQTPERDKWLIFTQPILTDEFILITREDHPFIVDLASMDGQTMSLPKGTSIEERVRKDYPQLKIILTDTEAQALQMVSDRKAEITMRPLIASAYTIKREGWFNLKIAGQVPGYANQLRIGVLKGETELRDILNQGIASISAYERQKIVDRHITISAGTAIDYTLIKQLIAIIVLILLTSLFWLRKLHLAKRLLERKTEQQRMFIAMLSHQVRTPLSVIDASLQVLMLRLTEDTDKLPQLKRIQRGAARLGYFFDNCLTSDRIEDENFAVQPLAIDMAQLVTWVAESAALLSPEHSIQLDIEPDLPALLGDQLLLRILIMNLLSNALKYSPPATPIRVQLRRKSGDFGLCCIAVEDQGCGIPADELELIFQKYQRGRSAQGTPGAGLGLSLVSRITKLHGGTISVESNPGKGTRFTIEIPFLVTNARTSKK
jgi:signal transduction histidine kinase